MSKFSDKVFYRGELTCPWWLCFTFDNPLRVLVQNPVKILRPYLKEGYNVLDIGPGMGYFTIPISKMIGKGKVYALDIQEQMLARLRKKIAKKNFENIEIKQYDGSSFNIAEKFDLVLLFWMFHEVTNKDVFVNEIKAVMNPTSKILVVEPKIHVTKESFSESLKSFHKIGIEAVEYPKVGLSRSVVLMLKQNHL
jgi:ubiquinone/menaquinone biosynthesis C-methylase UbiE